MYFIFLYQNSGWEKLSAYHYTVLPSFLYVYSRIFKDFILKAEVPVGINHVFPARWLLLCSLLTLDQ